MKDEFLKKLKTAKILRITMIVLAVVSVFGIMMFTVSEIFVYFAYIAIDLIFPVGIIYFISYNSVAKCAKWFRDTDSEHVFDDIPPNPTLPKSRAYCGSKCIVFKKPFVVIPYYEIAWVYIQVDKAYGITISKQVHIYCLSGAHFFIKADASEVEWLLQNYLLRLNPNIILGCGYEQKRQYRELKKITIIKLLPQLNKIIFWMRKTMLIIIHYLKENISLSLLSVREQPLRFILLRISNRISSWQ